LRGVDSYENLSSPTVEVLKDLLLAPAPRGFFELTFVSHAILADDKQERTSFTLEGPIRFGFLEDIHIGLPAAVALGTIGA
jgi:hypothetical protein